MFWLKIFLILFISSSSAYASDCSNHFSIKNFFRASSYPLRETKKAIDNLARDPSLRNSKQLIRQLELEVSRKNRSASKNLDIFQKVIKKNLHKEYQKDFYELYAKSLEENKYYQEALLFYTLSNNRSKLVDIHKKILQELQGYQVASYEEFARESATLTLKSKTKNNFKVILKPNHKTKGYNPWIKDHFIFHTSRNEFATFLIAEELGIHTPLMTYKKDFKYEKFNELTIQMMISDNFLNKQVVPDQSEFQIFDYLIGNLDRYKYGNKALKNYLAIPILNDEYLFMHIDGGAAFTPHQMLLQSKRFISLSKFKFPIRKEQFLKLKQLKNEKIKSILLPYLSEEIIAQTIKRRETLIDFIQKRVQNYGEESVFVSN